MITEAHPTVPPSAATAADAEMSRVLGTTLVVGASRGLGRGAAAAFADAGSVAVARTTGASRPR